MTLEGWLGVADKAYFGAAIIALIATALTIVAGVAQNRLNARISDNKDRAFNEFRVASETRVAVLQKLTAEANQRTEEERTARLALEAKFAWRIIPKDVGDKVKGALTSKLGLIKVAYIANDPESLFVATQIISILKASGQEYYPEAETYYQRLFFGIIIPGPDNDAVSALRQAFSGADYPTETIDVPAPDMFFGPQGLVPVATILVGSKVPPVSQLPPY